MNIAPHLRPEDRPDFERVLDEALLAEPIHEALHAPGARLNAEQLHTRALAAAGAIAAAAAGEYGYYTALRDQVREAAAAPRGTHGEQSTGQGSLTAAAQRAAEEGAGAVPVMTVLAPILAWTSAIVFLLLGYGLRTAQPDLVFARSLVTAGWVSLAVGAVAMLIGTVGLLLTALRDGSTPPDGQDPELYAELAEARSAWRAALRERGIVPFLYRTLYTMSDDALDVLDAVDTLDTVEALDPQGRPDAEGDAAAEGGTTAESDTAAESDTTAEGGTSGTVPEPADTRTRTRTRPTWSARVDASATAAQPSPARVLNASPPGPATAVPPPSPHRTSAAPATRVPTSPAPPTGATNPPPLPRRATGTPTPPARTRPDRSPWSQPAGRAAHRPSPRAPTGRVAPACPGATPDTGG